MRVRKCYFLEPLTPFSFSHLWYNTLTGMKLAERILRLLILAILFTPLLAPRNMFYPFVAPKMLALEGLTLLAGLVCLYLWYHDSQRYQPKITWLALALLGYGAITLVAALFGVNFWRSFWSVYERMDGVFTWFILVFLFIIISAFYKKREDWIWLFRASLFASVILELKAMDFFLAPGGGLTLPFYISGTFGNPLFLGIYAIAHGTFALLLFSFLKLSCKKPGDIKMLLKNPWVWFYAFGFILNVLSIFLTTGIGPMAGFFLGTIVFAVFYPLYATGARARFLKGLGVALVLLLLTFPWWKNTDIPGRLGSVGLHTSPDRLINWKTAFQAFEDRPILGWGANNYGIAQNEFYDPHLLTITREGFDRTHNKYLEIAVDGGILGFLAYATIFVLIFFAIRKQRRKEAFLSALLLGFFVAYLVQNLTVFDNPGSYLSLFLVFAFINVFWFEPLRFQLKPRNWLVVGGCLLLAAFAWQGVWQPYKANKALAIAKTLSNVEPESQNHQRIFESYKKVLSYQTLGDYEARISLGEFLVNHNFPPFELLDFGISEIKKEINMSPSEVLLRVILGKLYEHRAMAGGGNEKEYVKKADQAFLDAIALSPSRVESREHYVVFLIDQGQTSKARQEMEKIKELEPAIFDGQRIQTYLASSYFMEKDFTKTYEILQSVIKRGGGFSSERDLLLLAQVTFELGKLDEMLHWYEKLVDTYKENPLYRMHLAAAYKEVGKSEYARNEALNAARLDPRLQKDADAFIKAL